MSDLLEDPQLRGDLSPGATFGRYVVESYLGGGGMASVYRARHMDLGRVVALKVIHAPLVSRPEHVERFLLEARTASSLRHPNVVDVSDVGSENGRPYLVMEHLTGESLAARLDRMGPMAPSAVAALMLPLLDAVSAAHAAGIVHRDIKPDNVFLAEDGRGSSRPVLLDFGVSKVVGGLPSKALTQVGQFVGTPMYMSPEQVQQQEPIDGRTDQYALGVVMYECVTGVLPFRSEQSLFVLLAEVVFGRPEPPSTHAPHLPKAFEHVILRAMAATRDARFPSVASLAQALVPFAPGEVQAHWAKQLGAPLPAVGAPSGPPPSLRGTVPPPSPSYAPPAPSSRAPQRRPVDLSGAALRALPVFEDRSADELDAFLLAVSVHAYPMGARLFHQGETADACYVLVTGSVDIVKEVAGTRGTLNVVRAGEIVGQIALVEDTPRSATVVAREEVIAIELSREVFRRLLASGSPVAMGLQRLVAVSGIRQLRNATKRLSRLLEERGATAPERDATLSARHVAGLEELRAAVVEWSVKIGTR